MDVASAAINESQWILCLFQITGLMLICWVVGRFAIHKFPDVSASVGVVGLLVSTGLIVATWSEIPRPFELTTRIGSTQIPGDSKPARTSMERRRATIDSPSKTPTWFGNLTNLFKQKPVSSSHNGTVKSTSLWTGPRFTQLLLLLTMLGGLAGVFRVIFSSITIHKVSRLSSPVADHRIQTEVSRILALLPIARQHQDIPVRQFNGQGSPFVSWLTGNTIFVPESFLTWSDSEKSVSLAHEIGHLQRRDHYCRIVTQLAFCLTWLHPMAWILHRQTVLAQELAADQVAAQTTTDPSAYSRGLSRLALRFDTECRHPSALGVSVSSSLIRRITMLKEVTFHRLPCSRFVNRCITFSALVASTWIGCWSVSGQTETQETQTDSKVVTASHVEPVKMFSRPVATPWEETGNQPGYFKIHVNRILNHPYFASYKPTIAAVLDPALRSEPNETRSFKQFGLALDDIDQLQGGLIVSFHFNAESDGQSRPSLGLALPKVQITADAIADWPGLIRAFDFEKLKAFIPSDSRVDLEKVQKAWIKSAKKSRSHTFEVDPLLAVLWKQPVIDWEAPTETKKAIWDAVSGGAVTVVYDIDQRGKVPEDYEDQNPLTQARIKMTAATETAAWGVDLSQDNKTCHIRFAAVPRAGLSADDLLEKFESIRHELEQITDAEESHFFQQLKKAKVTIVKGKRSNGITTKPYLLVEGECPVVRSLSLLEFL